MFFLRNTSKCWRPSSVFQWSSKHVRHVHVDWIRVCRLRHLQLLYFPLRPLGGGSVSPYVQSAREQDAERWLAAERGVQCDVRAVAAAEGKDGGGDQRLLHCVQTAGEKNSLVYLRLNVPAVCPSLSAADVQVMLSDVISRSPGQLISVAC